MKNQKMKSPALFALHFAALLLLGSLQSGHNLKANAAEPEAVSTPGAAAALPDASTGSSKSSNARVAATTTTTLPPPSLPKPNRSWLRTTTTPMTLLSSARTTTTTTTTITTRKPTTNEIVKRHKSVVIRAPLQKQQRNIAPTIASNEAATFTSTRLVRNINGTLRHNVRQNRSFQSIDVSHTNTSAVTNSTNNNNNSNTINNDVKRNHRRVHRQLSALERNDSGSISTTSPTIATKATTTPSQTAATTIPTHQRDRFLPTSQSSSSSSPTSATRSSSSKPESRSTFITTQRHPSNQQQQQQQQQLKQQRLASVNSEDEGKQAQTTKTPRMIHRLMAGHIQNSEGRLRYQISTITTNSTVTKSVLTRTTTSQPKSSINFRRKTELNDNQKSILKTKFDPAREHFNFTNTNNRKDPKTLVTAEAPYNDRDDDEALLDESDDFDNWDNGILRSSAGAGKENLGKSKKTKEETKKTLSDQVRDGKYGLIEHELFRREPKRPGVLSYLPNKEIPIDNDRNFGGLKQEDIWLAEDHLLVIKGGSLNEEEAKEPWPAIDDYDDPGRPIKLPPNPKVPPPFPVQLDENGPLQFIGNNKFTLVYPVTNESLSVYTAGPEAHYASPESDDEKNLITRPGSPQSLAEEEPGYIYPPPIPSWLYQNQTFVNPFLKNARPINLPSLGLFPFGYNDSRGNNSDADYFDEDDPSLYYPPPYSFVYKSNYSSPVPPGPLVPGIVLPPPPNQFSRLQKPKSKFATSSTLAPSRHRVISTTTTTTTTASTTMPAPKLITPTAPSTTATPYRQTITRISEYTPKIITITSASPLQNTISTSRPKDFRRQPPLPRPGPPAILDQVPVPVPVAIPVPILPPKHIVSVRPSHLLFGAPGAPKSTTETFSKSHPIYYEYYDPTTVNARDGIASTTPKPITLPKKLLKPSKRPLRPLVNQPNYLQSLPPPYGQDHPYGQENVQIYIAPKPKTRPYSLKFSTTQQQQQQQHEQEQQQQQTLLREGVLANFEREVSAIRQRVRFYQNQQLRDNDIPRTPKAKPLHDEFPYDAEDPAAAALPESRSFQPPAEYDEEPFKPMVTYSPEVGDEKYFRAVTTDGAHGSSVPAAVTNQKQKQRLRYAGTTRTSQQFGHGRLKKQRNGSTKYLEQSPQANYQRQQQQQQQQHQHQQRRQQQQQQRQYNNNHRHLQDTRQISPWLPLDEQTELNNFRQTALAQQHQTNFEHYDHSPNYDDITNDRNRNFHGYYYASPQVSPPIRQNNRFYEEPFQNAQRKIINTYRPPIPPPPQQQQQRVPPVWSLENDTYVNFAPNHPPINPDAEFINPFQTFPINHYENRNQQPLAPPPPPRQTLPPSHQSHYYGQPERFPLGQNNHRHQQHQQHHQQPRQPPISLDRDILVNYHHPLPPINPDSEYIPSGPQVVHPQTDSIHFHSNVYPVPVSSSTGSGQSAVETLNPYYLSQKYRRNSDNRHHNNHHTNNNNNNNNNNNDNNIKENSH